jgi:hypothetical protein
MCCGKFHVALSSLKHSLFYLFIQVVSSLSSRIKRSIRLTGRGSDASLALSTSSVPPVSQSFFLHLF